MLSFLPKKEKSELLKDYRSRLLSVGLGLLSIFFLVASIGILPAYLNEKAKNDELALAIFGAKNLENNEESQIKEREASNKILADYLLNQISSIQTSPVASDVISEALKNKPSSVSIASISFSGTGMIIGGVAATRSDLIAYHNSLKDNDLFKDVSLPISNIAKSEDADFVLEISLK